MTRLLNIRPRAGLAFALAIIPIVLLAGAYLYGSAERLEANPRDKLLPAPSTLFESAKRLATEPDRRSGDILLWKDTAASLQRLSIGVACAALLALSIGVVIGSLPLVKATLAPTVNLISMVPPMAVLPILFIVFGLGETAKIALIVFGIAPFLIRELALRVSELPIEQIVKAQTLGASSWQVIIRVIVPQVLPRLLDGIRLALGPAWIFLIAAEAIASTEGLGYRIFLVRRYLAMDVILPYVVWITLIAFLTDIGLRRLSAFCFPWYASSQR